MAQQLNRYQQQAVQHKDGPCLVTSCPGSGKTFTLVERIVALIQSGVKPKNILSLTFTNKAANEMKERVCRRLGLDDPEFFIGTFHSLCARMLRKIGPGRGYASSFTILDDKDQLDLINQIARQMEVEDFSYQDCYAVAHRVNEVRDQMEDLDTIRATLSNDLIGDIAEEYLDRCKKNNLIDFSGLIYETIKIIEEDDDLRAKIQNTFKYILVDETQDTNKSQFHLVNLLGGKWNNIMIIGDVDQSIYGWRGARYQNIQEFLDTNPDCQIICLSKNYRSTPQIVEVASTLIRNNVSHMKTPFETDNPAGDPVRCYHFKDQNKEADWVGFMISRLKEEGGWDYSDVAVLYRVNKMSEPIEQVLVNKGIPYEVIGNWNFYDRREVKDCLAMAKVLINPKDGIAFHRAAKLMDGLGDVTVGRIENAAEANGTTLIKECRDMSKTASSARVRNACARLCDIYEQGWDHSNPAQCFSTLISSFEYGDYIDRTFVKDAPERRENVQQVIESASDFTGDGALSEYMQKVSLITSSDKETEDDKVALMSLHAAKGLEFPVVFIIGTEEEIIPHKNSIAENPFDGVEEERRLCYVGLTRAKKMLYVTYCVGRHKFTRYGSRTVRAYPSRFLFEAGLLESE